MSFINNENFKAVSKEIQELALKKEHDWNMNISNPNIIASKN
jgi:hypothetical protein